MLLNKLLEAAGIKVHFHNACFGSLLLHFTAFDPHSPRKEIRVVFQFVTKLEDCCYRTGSLGQCFSQGTGSEEVSWS